MLTPEEEIELAALEEELGPQPEQTEVQEAEYTGLTPEEEQELAELDAELGYAEVSPAPKEPEIKREELTRPFVNTEALDMFDQAIAQEDKFLADKEIQELMAKIRDKAGDANVFGRLMDKTLKQSPATDEGMAGFWGAVYQSESDPVKMKQFIKHQSTELQEGVLPALDSALKAFKGDKKHNTEKLRRIMIAIAKHESLGGKKLVQGKGGPARGAWQVETETALDVIRTSGLIGGKAEKLLGKTKQEILSMSENELKNYLKDHTVNAVFAVAKTLQAADAKDRLEFIK